MSTEEGGRETCDCGYISWKKIANTCLFDYKNKIYAK